MRSGRAVTIVLGGVLVWGVSGCSSGPDPSDEVTRYHSVSRVRLYESIADMSESSPLIVVGTVTNQRVVRDIDPDLDFTISTVSVESVVQGQVESGTAKVPVRQTGSAEQGSAGEILVPGDTYLLFLRPTELPGDAAREFYVTGVSAGVYRASTGVAARGGQVDEFQQVAPEPGEDLPTVVTLDEVVTELE